MIPLDRVRAMVAAATPGPWVWRSDDTDGCHVVEDPRARYEEEERLAETFRESTADIILMAAAPDLARDVLTLADALATAERERDAALASADLSARAAVDAARELGHVAAAAIARADAADARSANLLMCGEAAERASDVLALIVENERLRALAAQHAADVAAASRSTRESCAATLRARAECLRRYAYEATAKADATEYTHDASEVDACAAIVASVALAAPTGGGE